MEQRDWVSQIPLRDVDFISVTYSSKVWSVFGRVVVAAVVVADVDDVDGVVSDVVAVGVVDYVDGVVADIDGVVSDVVAVGGGWVIAANGDGFVWSLSRVLALHLSATSGRKNLNEGQFSDWTNHSFLLSCFRSHLIPHKFWYQNMQRNDGWMGFKWDISILTATDVPTNCANDSSVNF